MLGRRVLAGLLAVGALVGGAVPARAEDPPVPDQVRSALAQATARSTSAEVIVDGQPGVPVAVGADQPLAPASTEKLLVGTTALFALGAGYRFVTDLVATGPVVDGVLAGDLVWVGSGDPMLTGAHLDDLAAQVAAAGVTRVTGVLRGDDSRFDRMRGGVGWKATYVPGESGPLSAVAVDHDTWRRDADYLANPAGWNLVRLRNALAAAGVGIDGTNELGPAPMPVQTVVARHESAPLSAILAWTLKASDNFAAEMVLKAVGAARGNGSTLGGLAAIYETADGLGVPRTRAYDGSGLSAWDRASADQQVRYLQVVAHTDHADELRDALPVACVDGTLVRRMCGSPAAGRARAKTGSLPGVVSLAGYTTTANGKTVVFSFLLSGVANATTARAALDRAVAALSGWTA